MAQGSNIEWTDATWNPVSGCTRVSAGCDHCYAVAMTNRLEAMGQEKYSGLTVLNPKGDRHFNGTVRTHDDALKIPLGWKRPKRVFANSMSDLFHKDVPFEFIDKVFAVMALTPQHTYQLLTKRPERMTEYCQFLLKRGTKCLAASKKFGEEIRIPESFPLPNVWLGTSVEDQKTADERIPHLLKCPAAVRFLSCEPLLGPIDFSRVPGFNLVGARGVEMLRNLWVIAGGESGHGARPMNPHWVRSLRDQCQTARVPFFFKQWGEFTADIPLPEWPKPIFWLGRDGSQLSEAEALAGGGSFTGMYRVGKKAAGRILDGRTWNEFPITAAEAIQS